MTILVAETLSTYPSSSARTVTPESTAHLCSMPVATMGASVVMSGTAWRLSLIHIFLGLAMGSGTVFSIRFGQKDERGLKEGILASFALLGLVTLVLNILVFAGIDQIIWFLRTPDGLMGMMEEYLSVIFAGLIGIFLYNFFSSLLRSLGNSMIPLAFLAVSAGLNIACLLYTSSYSTPYRHKKQYALEYCDPNDLLPGRRIFSGQHPDPPVIASGLHRVIQRIRPLQRKDKEGGAHSSCLLYTSCTLC